MLFACRLLLLQHYEEGFEMHTSRATAAGFIMCSVVSVTTAAGMSGAPAAWPKP